MTLIFEVLHDGGDIVPFGLCRRLLLQSLIIQTLQEGKCMVNHRQDVVLNTLICQVLNTTGKWSNRRNLEERVGAGTGVRYEKGQRWIICNTHNVILERLHTEFEQQSQTQSNYWCWSRI